MSNANSNRVPVIAPARRLQIAQAAIALARWEAAEERDAAEGERWWDRYRAWERRRDDAYLAGVAFDEPEPERPDPETGVMRCGDNGFGYSFHARLRLEALTSF